jgi:predicted short-subunit dehydrogenase-like oxidoreductase (DUF2520 family)
VLDRPRCSITSSTHVVHLAPALLLLQWVLSFPAIGIVGSGRVAQALGRVLLERGEHVTCIASREAAHARTAATFLGCGVEAVGLAAIARRASHLLIAVADRAIADAAVAVASSGMTEGVVLHTCGAREIDELKPLRELGWACGVLHPLQTFSSPSQGMIALPGSTFAVSGDDCAVAWAKRIADVVGGRAVEVIAGKRALYHAAAAMASNYSVSLLDAAGTLMAAATGTEHHEALRLLAPLIRTSIENAFSQGTAEALTGPIERGDSGTVALHLEALSTASRSIRDLYVSAGLHTLDLARRKGLAEPGAASVEGVLEQARA